jgi:hypothetical protein
MLSRVGTMGIPTVKSIKKLTSITSAVFVAQWLSFSALALIISAIHATEKPGKCEIKPRKTLNNVRAKMIVH